MWNLLSSAWEEAGRGEGFQLCLRGLMADSHAEPEQNRRCGSFGCVLGRPRHLRQLLPRITRHLGRRRAHGCQRVFVPRCPTPLWSNGKKGIAVSRPDPEAAGAPAETFHPPISKPAHYGLSFLTHHPRVCESPGDPGHVGAPSRRTAQNSECGKPTEPRSLD